MLLLVHSSASVIVNTIITLLKELNNLGAQLIFGWQSCQWVGKFIMICDTLFHSINWVAFLFPKPSICHFLSTAFGFQRVEGKLLSITYLASWTVYKIRQWEPTVVLCKEISKIHQPEKQHVKYKTLCQPSFCPFCLLQLLVFHEDSW